MDEARRVLSLGLEFERLAEAGCFLNEGTVLEGGVRWHHWSRLNTSDGNPEFAGSGAPSESATVTTKAFVGVDGKRFIVESTAHYVLGLYRHSGGVQSVERCSINDRVTAWPSMKVVDEVPVSLCDVMMITRFLAREFDDDEHDWITSFEKPAPPKGPLATALATSLREKL